ncbi:MAG TPA: alpha/beta hydrolase [Rugosimonospora sp.]|nr:alpha/beta hydrolase [Rugosimonospora sp.]
MTIGLRGLDFEVHAAGPEGGRPVLLLHGFPQHSGMWDLVTPALHAAGLRTVALDQRGYSPGARPARVAAYAQVEAAADVVALLDALDLESAYLVGHDWGALVAWQVAGRYPERVRTLTAVSVPHPVTFFDAVENDADQAQRSRYVGLFQQEGRAERLLAEDDQRRLRAMFEGVAPDRVESYLAPLREPGALTAALNWYRAISPADLEGLGKVTVPTTFLWGDQDAAVGPVAAARCAEQVTGDYRFRALPGAGHWIADTAPDALASAILERIGA